MSLVANALGAFNGIPSFMTSSPALGTAYGSFVKPGGRIAAYVRSTGALEGDDYFAASGMLVATIDAGLARCRDGQNDVVFVLPGHSETFSSSGAVFANLVAGAQIIGVGTPGATNCPTITLSHTGASLALNKANVTFSGMRVLSTTAAVTGAIVITGAWTTFAENFVSLTGALGANSALQITGATGATVVGNHIVVNSTQQIVDVTSASSNIQILNNLIRQAQATSGGIGINVADAASTGFVANNYIQTATNRTSTNVKTLVVIGSAALPGIGTHQNFANDATGGSAILTPAANTDAG